LKHRTPLKEVRFLGSAKEGVNHWWAQKLTAVALIPLCLWFVASLFYLFQASRADLVEWLSNPINATLMVLLIGATFWHTKLGMEVVVEDYVHTPWLKMTMLITITFGTIAFGTASIVAVAMLALGG
jgi:succinate dehydrogenase / fumarate reductase membrane anchor subunit